MVAVACASVPAALLPDLQQADAASNLPRNVPERRLAEPPRRVTRCVSLALGWGTQDTQLSAIIGTHEYGVLHDPPSWSALRRPVADLCVRLCTRWSLTSLTQACTTLGAGVGSLLRPLLIRSTAKALQEEKPVSHVLNVRPLTSALPSAELATAVRPGRLSDRSAQPIDVRASQARNVLLYVLPLLRLQLDAAAVKA